MRIAILLPDLRGGGAERLSIDLARAFAAQGIHVEFVLMNATGDFLDEASREFKIINLKAKRIRNVPFSLSRYLQSNRPSALIANMWPLTGAAALGRALSRQNCRLLLVEHNTLSLDTHMFQHWPKWLMQTLMAVTYPMADRVSAVSQGAATDLEHLVHLPEGKVTVLHNPIPQRPTPTEHAKAIAESFWQRRHGKRILAVGSFKDQKNFSLLLRAFSKLLGTDATLLLLGQGAGESTLRALASQLGIADRVIFAGFHTDTTPFYATADLFALSSDYEGFGNVIVEALSFGLPVVSTDCPHGPAEILENGRWGRLVPVGDADALARAMHEALSAPIDREALKRRAADFAPEIVARRYLDLLGLA